MMHCLVDGQTKGPFIPLPTGRRDGNRSVAADVALFSPAPDANITDIINLFAIRFNLTAKDVAVLSGMLVVASSSYFPICCSVEEIGNFIIV
jgi:peroxidase